MSASLPLDLLQNAAALRDMLDGHRSALVVVDVQRDFAAPDGAMAAAGMDLSAVEPTIDRIGTLLAAARGSGIDVVWLRVVTRPESDSSAARLLNRRRGYPDSALAVCRADTPGADYYRLSPQSGELQIAKTLYSGFHGTALHAALRERGIDTLFFCGLTTECCVDSTVRDAFHLDYSVFLVADACATYGDVDNVVALDNLAKSFGLLVDTRTACEAWQAP